MSLSERLVGAASTSNMSIEEWNDYLHEGEQYLATALNAYKKGKKAFTAEILYNLIAIAIEKFFMGALMRHGFLPYNHTMHDLVAAMDEKLPGFLDEIRDRVLALDAHQEICSIEEYNRRPPSMDEIPEMLGTAQRVRDLIMLNSNIIEINLES